MEYSLINECAIVSPDRCFRCNATQSVASTLTISVNEMFEHRQLMQANGYEKRGAGLAGKDKWIRAPTLTTQ